MGILDQVQMWSSLAPNHPAHISDGSVVTYAELEQNSNRLAAYLSISLPDDYSPIAVVGHKEPEMLVAFLAAVKSGHPYIPIDDSTPTQRKEWIIKMTQVSICLTVSKIRDLLAEEVVEKTAFLPRKIEPDDPWYIIFTSGSTGTPKGVIITAACLESFVTWMLEQHHFLNLEEIFLNQAPFSFDLSVMDLYLSLASGGTLFSLTQNEIANPRQLFTTLKNSNASVWVSTPSFAQLCRNEPTFCESMLPGLRKFLFCGETLPGEAAADLRHRFPSAEVWNTYGPTEATCATTSIQITNEVLSQYNPLPIGYPKPDSPVFLLKADGSPAEGEDRGEIVITGPNVSPGYFGQPDLTQKAFFQSGGQRAYRTGDLGHFQNGLLFFDGRIDHQIKLHGYRIEPGDIEANLLSLASITDAVVLPHLKDGQPDFLAAFVILTEKTDQSEFEWTRLLKRELKQLLPVYMLPHKFYFMDQFPMTSNSKMDRRKLAEMLK